MSERYVKAGPWCTQKQLSELPMGLTDEVMARVRAHQEDTSAKEEVVRSNEPFKVTDMSFLYNTTNDNYGDKFAGKFKPQRTKMCKWEVLWLWLDCLLTRSPSEHPQMVTMAQLIDTLQCSKQASRCSTRNKPERATENDRRARGLHSSMEAGNEKATPNVLD